MPRTAQPTAAPTATPPEEQTEEGRGGAATESALGSNGAAGKLKLLVYVESVDPPVSPVKKEVHGVGTLQELVAKLRESDLVGLPPGPVAVHLVETDGDRRSVGSAITSLQQLPDKMPRICLQA